MFFYNRKTLSFFFCVHIFISADQTPIIESTWPENLLPIQSRVFPNDLSYAKTRSNCNEIVNTEQTAVDRKNGLLWLLDNGSKYCTPKLIVFDLLRGNNEVTVKYRLKFDLKSFHSRHIFLREILLIEERAS